MAIVEIFQMREKRNKFNDHKIYQVVDWISSIEPIWLSFIYTTRVRTMYESQTNVWFGFCIGILYGIS